MDFVQEHPILTIFGILAVFIFIMIKSTWSHRIGYVIFLLLVDQSSFEKIHEWLHSLIVDHPFWEFIYSDVFFLIVLIYGIIGLPEVIIRIFDPLFSFGGWIFSLIERKTYARRMGNNEKFARKEMGADHINVKLQEGVKQVTAKGPAREQTDSWKKHRRDRNRV